MDNRPDKFLQSADRRLFCQRLLGCAVSGIGIAGAGSAVALNNKILNRTIPGTEEQLPVIGMGSWITFDVPFSTEVWNQRAQVLETFFEQGGAMIDSSPMYGYAEEAIGYALETITNKQSLFSASKIWTPLGFMGGSQMTNTEDLWGVKPMDLMFVHNLLAWRKHLPRLRDWQAEGRIRYIGLSTSHGRRHDELEKLMRTEKVDFIQLTLNIDQIEAEKKLLPLAADLGIGVVINRPFQRGALLEKYSRKPLPPVAAELGCQHWAQYLLLYIVSHPAVTCAIPATSRVEHMLENMGTLRLAMPDQAVRQEMRQQLS